jgi:hypothetical protein
MRTYQISAEKQLQVVSNYCKGESMSEPVSTRNIPDGLSVFRLVFLQSKSNQSTSESIVFYCSIIDHHRLILQH